MVEKSILDLKDILKDIFSLVFIGRLLLTIAGVAATAWVVAWFVSDWAVEKALTAQTSHIEGVETTQESDRRLIVEGDKDVRVDLGAAITESSKRLEAAINVLSSKMDGLGDKLETSGNKVAELTGTVNVLNSKLDGSITRQTTFEQFVMARLLKEDPDSAEPAKAMIYWGQRGIERGAIPGVN